MIAERRRAAGWGIAVVVACFLAAFTGHAGARLTQTVTNTTNSASSRVNIGTCEDAIRRDGALWAFSLTDTGANAANLTAPTLPGTYQNGGTAQTGIRHQTGPSGCTRDVAGFVSVLSREDGNTGNAGWVNGPAAGLAPGSLAAGFTGEVWFRTNTTAGGNLFALGTANFVASAVGLPPLLSGGKDHQLFMFADGRLSFALYKGTNLQVNSTASYNDNVWHHAVGTVSPTAGSALYVDGVLVGTSPTATSGDVDNQRSYLHLGYESLVGWTGAPLRWAWTGDLAYAALYTSPLTATQVRTHYRAGI